MIYELIIGILALVCVVVTVLAVIEAREWEKSFFEVDEEYWALNDAHRSLLNDAKQSAQHFWNLYQTHCITVQELSKFHTKRDPKTGRFTK